MLVMLIIDESSIWKASQALAKNTQQRQTRVESVQSNKWLENVLDANLRNGLQSTRDFIEV